MLRLLQPKKIDATKGPILSSLLIYAIPIIISVLVQDLFNTVDMVVLANMADSVAYASVGATSTITMLIINSFFGLSTGVKILLSHYWGAGDKENVQKTINTSISMSFLLGLIIAFFGVLFAPMFLTAVKCPEECMAGAALYIRLYVAAAPAILVYNFGAAVIRSMGDSQRPLYYIIICGLVNIILNVILCLILPQKVAAVAIATVTSQILGAILVVRRVCALKEFGNFDLRHMRVDFSIFKKILRHGLPVAISSSLFPLANLQIVTAVNSFGVSGIAGNTAAHTLEKFTAALGNGFGAATIAFVGQNLGAEKKERVKSSIFHCLWISTLSSGVFGFLLYLTADFWLAILQPNDPVAADFAKIRMLYLLCFYALNGLIHVFSGILQAYGYTILNTATSLTTVLVFRTLWMQLIYPHFETYPVLMQCFTVSLILRALAYFIFFIMVWRKYQKGKYTKLR